jgi:2-keto-3-deoxy-L-rhamnonate aldolase RhmA
MVKHFHQGLWSLTGAIRPLVRSVAQPHSAEDLAALDVAFIRPVDLSVGLGTPGGLGSEPMQQAPAVIGATAGRAGVPMGIFSGSADAAESARAKWYRYITSSAPT